MRPRVAIAGGSLGGLTAALVLRDAGCDVDVYERSRDKLQSTGAGIVLHEETERYLVEDGAPDLTDVSVGARWWRYVDAAGAVVHREPCRHRFTSWGSLYRALLGRLEPDRYHLGSEVVGFTQHDDTVRVGFADGSRVECDLLVCADGAASSVRSLLLPDARPVYAGYTGWRGTAKEADLSAVALADLDDTITYHVTADGHILCYPIPGRLTNFVWYRNVAKGADLDALVTDRDGVHRPLSVPPGKLAERYVADLRDAATALPPSLAEVVRGAAEPFVQVIFDVTVDRMVFGRVCLLGDAAFCARPHAAAGTAKAAADAWALASAVRAHLGDLTAALAAWEPAQLALGRQLVARTRRMGERSQVEHTWHPGDPSLAFGLRGPGR